ncbi:hypothetical protein TNCV_4136431 [Trichonephila clavipes]|nr:hypothetical protein TNCV_4136431 [Trichonephila clavipes]
MGSKEILIQSSLRTSYATKLTRPLGAKMHEQMSRSDGQSEERPLVFKSSSKLGTHLSTQCSRDERLSQPCSARE